MISLTKLDGTQIVINAEEIETVESRFDTVISLKSGNKVRVVEKAEEITSKVVEYKKKVYLSERE